MVLAADVKLLPPAHGAKRDDAKRDDATSASTSVVLYEHDDGTAVKRTQAVAGDEILAGGSCHT